MNHRKILIAGKRVLLRSLTTKDATPRYVNWLNDPTVNKYLETRKASLSQIRNYIKEKNSRPNTILLGIFYKINQLHIGNVKLEPIDFENTTAQLGLLIGDKDYWGMGLGTEVTQMVVSWAFGELKLKKLELGVIGDNIAAIKAYQKAGFKVSSKKKNAINHDDVLFDEVIMTINA